MITIEDVKRMAQAGGYKRIPISRELYADQRTPVEVLKILSGVSSDCFLFESGEDITEWGRYTYLGFQPAMKLTCKDGAVTITGGKREKVKEADSPKEVIRQILKDYRSPKPAGMPGFTGGLAGYFSYGYMKYGKGMPEPAKGEGGDFPDAYLMLFDQVIAFDRFRQKVLLIANADTADLEAGYVEAERKLDEMEKLIRHGEGKAKEGLHLKDELKPFFDQEDYSLMAEMCREYIRSGDSFWMVLANGLEGEMEGSLLDLYRVLRANSPSPYLFYLSGDGREIAGTAPGTFVKLEKEKLSATVMTAKGSRGESRKEELRLERELLADEGQRAWHNLLVDLARNDLSQACRRNTVRLEPYLGIGRQDHGICLASAASGRIARGWDGLDAVEAFLPGGKFVGAPKAKNGRLLGEIEQKDRGLFGGAIGYLDFSGNMDLCAPEQLACVKEGHLTLQAGIQLKGDGEPERAWQQWEEQASSLLHALEIARKGEEL